MTQHAAAGFVIAREQAAHLKNAMVPPIAPDVRLEPKGRVLLIDDDETILKMYARMLRDAGYAVVEVLESRLASNHLTSTAFDVVLTDVNMPSLDGVGVLQAVRSQDPDLPVVMMSAAADLPSALKAVEHGALRYLTKPVDRQSLLRVVEYAVDARRLAEIRRQAVEQYRDASARESGRLDLFARFERALDTVQMVSQPMIRWSDRTVFAHEVLVRSAEPTLGHPNELFAAAVTLGRLHDLGRTIRHTVAMAMREPGTPSCVFVNLHPRDLDDDDLLSGRSPLAHVADRVVLEVTEFAALDSTQRLQDRLRTLRDLGYRFALDDLGAGYAGLSSFAVLRPEVVKLDRSLVQRVAEEPTKQKLILSMITLCRDLGMQIVAEGIETVGERDVVTELGCDLLQGYLFGRPGPLFSTLPAHGEVVFLNPSITSAVT